MQQFLLIESGHGLLCYAAVRQWQRKCWNNLVANHLERSYSFPVLKWMLKEGPVFAGST